MAGGPAEDLDDYAAGADACEAFLVLMQTGAETLGDFHAVDAIQSFLASDVDWDARATRGWTASRREAMESRCDEILGRDGWDDRIAVALLSDDPAEFWRAERAARRRGIDTFEIHVDKIRREPVHGWSWFHAWEQADAARAEQLTELTRTPLPLDQIATGPADALGVAHVDIDWTLQAPRHHPGVGADLVLVGLESPVVRNGTCR